MEHKQKTEAGADAPDSTLEQKPRLRGVLHQYGAIVAAAAGILLVWIAPTRVAAAAAGVFAASLVVLLAVSASYHRINWSVRGRAWMRRADHAAIFILIAGTYTPIAVLGLPDTADLLLLIIWGGALLGVLQALFWVKAPKALVAALAVAVGWTVVPYIGEVRAAYGDGVFGLLLAGGIAYSLGAVAYATRRPRLVPSIFGYHEVFHALTLVGAGLHFAAVLNVVRAVA